MAKSTTGRSRFKMQRALGIELPGLGKGGALEKRPNIPGMHGGKRRKASDYSVRLKEKQKLLYHYGLREKQLVKYVKSSKRDKSRAWMDTLLMTLESRLNNVVFRLNFASSIPAASQMVSHGQVQVNGKKVDISSFLVKKGDIISLSEKGYKNQTYKLTQESGRLPAVPECYRVEGDENKKATLVDRPQAADLQFEFEGQHVIEYYWKVK